MFRTHHRKALLVSAALVGGTLLMTACEDGDATKDSGAAQSSAPASSAAASATPSGSAAAGSGKGSGAKGQGSDDSADAGSGVDAGDGTRVPVEQGCGANDITWSTRSESQAGGYILVMAKAKPGITCYLPGTHPVVAFGSDGTEAGPAEQAVGEPIKLSGGTTAYAGVNPRTSNTNGGKELDSIIVAVDDSDANPVSLKVGSITVDKAIVTNWHTAPKDAVPFS
ncbi:DUF4232 domain-containing protein [Streptomyces sp. KAU_LT]|uniref:DUF4232 domain-containing protein n=1 Tax=unclassified Streptomyces TaxID=2593676 RepID=UPI0024B6B593|nr:DUF4232 domain-containing protein [Streptomyces sp. KAU_LT]MDI9832226.1 DUF4232 domain-containing protein [Streptomyces sp. KAU_LT]